MEEKFDIEKYKELCKKSEEMVRIIENWRKE